MLLIESIGRTQRSARGADALETGGPSGLQPWENSPWNLFEATPPANCRRPDYAFGHTPMLGWPIHPLFDCDRSEAFWFDDFSPLIREKFVVRDFRCQKSDKVRQIFCVLPEDADIGHPGDAISWLLPCWSAFMEFGGHHANLPGSHLNSSNSNIEYTLVRKSQFPIEGWTKDICEQLGISFTTSLPAVRVSSRLKGPGGDKITTECATGSDYIVVRNLNRVGNAYHFSTIASPSVRTFLDLLRGFIFKGRLLNNAGIKRYFIRPEHAHMLRSAMNMRESLPSHASNDNLVKVLILNRIGTRRLLESTQIEYEIKRRTNHSQNSLPHSFYVTQVDDLGTYNGLEQAKVLYNHDIIISPHGNQLANIGFANECAALLEVYVEKMGIPGCFLPLATNAGVLSFGLYAGANIGDTKSSVLTRYSRDEIRSHNINLLDDIANMVPTMLHARISCCQKLVSDGHIERAVDARCMPLLHSNGRKSKDF
jgi:hypothetical protein